MSEIQVFTSEEFGSVRSLEIDGEPWFVGKDVTKILGYTNANKAIKDHVDPEDKGTNVLDTPGGKQRLVVINEAGLYTLVISSKLPTAKQFKRWIVSEVLPSIRKTGSYSIQPIGQSNEEILANAVLLSQRIIEENRKKISLLESDNARMKPKEEYYDAVGSSEATISMSRMAAILTQNGYPLGRNELFEWMGNHDFIIRSNNKNNKSHNCPTSKSMKMNLFKVKQVIIKRDGYDMIRHTPLVTGKGQLYFVNYFKNHYPEGYKNISAPKAI